MPSKEEVCEDADVVVANLGHLRRRYGRGWRGELGSYCLKS